MAPRSSTGSEHAAFRVLLMRSTALLLLPLALVLAAVSWAQAAAPAVVTPKVVVVITVRSIATASVPDDRPPAGPSTGDRFLIRDQLLNVTRQFGKKAGAVVGTDAGVFTMTSKTQGTVVGLAVLPGGGIHFHGVIHLKGANAALAVDGGTGRYAHVTGTLIVGAGKNPLNTYHLTLAGTNGGTTV
jgi:hypothetical protein